MSASSRSSPAHAGKLRRQQCLACRTSMRRHSWIDFLQESSEIGEAVTPEHAVMAHPVDERREALRLGAVVNVAAFGAFRDQPGQLQRLEVLRDGALRHPAPPRQFDHGDLVGTDDPLEHGPPGGIGERAHDGIDGGGLDHANQLAFTNPLVNTNLSDLKKALVADIEPTRALCSWLPLPNPWQSSAPKQLSSYDGIRRFHSPRRFDL